MFKFDFSKKHTPRFFIASIAIYSLLSLTTIFGAVLFFIYAIASAVAFDGAIIPLTLFASTFLCTGFAIASIASLIEVVKALPMMSGGVREEKEKPQKPSGEKVTYLSVIKDWLTAQNFTLVCVALGVLLAVVQLACGGFESHNWKDSTAPFKQVNGYYADSRLTEMHYDADALSHIVVDFNDKNAVVIFTTQTDSVDVEAYFFYTDELTYNDLSDGTLHLAQTPSPRQHKALDNMFWFIFDGGNSAQKQVLIYIPSTLKDSISIEGDYIIAQQ